MKLFKILSLLFVVATTNTMIAQELVVNGSFENFSNVPTGEAQWWRCNTWNNVNMSTGATATYATPDYYHADATIGNYDLPTSARGTISPHTGKAIMGLLCFNQVSASYANFREYLSSQLASPMVVGQTYTVSFWLSNAEATTQRRYGSTAKGFGIHFSTAPLSQPTRDIISVTPQIEVVAVAPWSANWTLHTFTYTATSAWQYITIGNFTATALQARTVQDASATYSAGSYYFIDDVSIIPITPLSVELSIFTAVQQDEVVELEWSTASENNNDYFTVERSTDLNNWQLISKVDGVGNATTENNYSLTDRNPVRGVNYYRLNQIDYDGKINFSGIRVVKIENDESPIIYPNPTIDKITIEAYWKSIEEYLIVDNFGRDLTKLITVSTGSSDSAKIFDLSSLPNGVYYFICNENKQRIIKL